MIHHAVVRLKAESRGCRRRAFRRIRPVASVVTIWESVRVSEFYPLFSRAAEQAFDFRLLFPLVVQSAGRVDRNVSRVIAREEDQGSSAIRDCA